LHRHTRAHGITAAGVARSRIDQFLIEFWLFQRIDARENEATQNLPLGSRGGAAWWRFRHLAQPVIDGPG